ncbi:protein RRP5 homolog [Phlebotomus argentipes]|uniref:protein RRP5 homolog n=1 Tax=Phlebotomus argentipes TaxID=94469 RepID=UPI00289357A7|nr:protein RRP5 homolog [Phlebotomus argentipes]
MVFVEKTFPRGGEIRRKKPQHSTSKQQFGVITKKFTKKKLKRNDKKSEDTGVAKEDSFESRKAELVTSRTVAEGMLMMGFVKSILPTDLLISLPGRLQGKVSISAISVPYSNCLEKMVKGEDQACKALSEMFKPGQEVYVKVVNIDKSEAKDNKKFELSLNPRDLHSELHHTKLHEGLIMCGAVKSIEDHGYTMDLGVNHVRAFLTSQESYSIGELVYCNLQKVKSTSSVTTVQLKECPKKRILSSEEDLLDHVLPTLTVKFIVLDTVRDGLMGKILDGSYTAYINQIHLGRGKVVDDFEIGSEIEAKVLYVMPLTKFVYLTLNSYVDVEKRIPFGRILENVETMGKCQSGILLNLPGHAKGLITYTHMKMGMNANIDQEELELKHKQEKISIVRVMDYNAVDDVYNCTDKQNLIREKYFCLADAKVGDFVQVKITQKVGKKGMKIALGQLHGFVQQAHMSKAMSGQKVDSKIRGRILYVDEQYKSVMVTTRLEYLKESAGILKDRKDIAIGQVYVGMIQDVTAKKILVQFFNRILGAVTKSPDLVNRSFYESMKPGKIVRVAVTSVNDKFINLAFTKDASEEALKCGKTLDAKVMGSYSSGVEVEVKATKSNIWIPNHYISESPEISQLLSATLESAEVQIVRVSDDIYSLRDVEHFHKSRMSSWKSLMAGMIVRAFVKSINDDCLEVHLPLKDTTKTVKIFYPMVLKNFQEGDEQDLFHLEQIIYVKVLNKDMKTQIVSCSALLSQVWSGNVYVSAKMLTTYFRDVDRIHARVKPEYKTSDIVMAKVEEVSEESVSVKIEGSVGVIPRNLVEAEANVGDELKCVVLWVAPEGVIYLSNKTNHMEMRKNKDHPPFSHIKQKGEIVLKTQHFFLVLLESNHVVYVPLKLHYNDFRPLCAGRNGECEVILLNDKGERVIAIFRDIFEECRKVAGTEGGGKRRQDSLTESDLEEMPQKKAKLEETPVKESVPQANLLSNFWGADFSLLPSVAKDASEAESDASDSETPAKKKKLTARERLEHAKAEEARIRDREESLADGISDPQSVDDFERLVLMTPNNSLIWIKYMVHYLQATEVEKARAVARRAIQSITYREQDDLVNVWVALLNLELRFGTQDSFDAVLRESLEVNDQFKITMRTIEMLADVRRLEELRAKASMAMKKFKTNPEMWPKVAAAFFTVGLAHEAKQLMHRAISVLPQRDHISIISSFAKLHNRFGEKETAHALLEQIVTSYPKRVDVWSMYVDMLVKDDRLDLARQVLERAVLQKLPLKKMRTLFKKYQELEEKHGDEQSVAKVKSMAEEFVQNYIKT